MIYITKSLSKTTFFVSTGVHNKFFISFHIKLGAILVSPT